MNIKENKLMMQFIAFLLVIVIMLSLYLLVNTSNHVISTTPSKKFKNEYCSLLRPPNWTGTLKGNTFLFENPEGTILVMTDQSPQYHYSAIDNSRKRLLNLLHETLKDKNIELQKITDLTIKNGQTESKFPTLKFSITTEDNEAEGTIFYSNDVRFFYFSKWTKGNKRNEYISNIFTDFIKLEDSLKTPLYERPIINSEDNIDSAKLIKKAKEKISQAIFIWRNSKKSSNDVLHALEAFERAMKLIAKSGMGDSFDEKGEKIFEIFQACRKSRTASINKMKSEIFQSKHLGNDKMAKELAEELIAIASLECEAEIRQWAKNQIKTIK